MTTRECRYRPLRAVLTAALGLAALDAGATGPTPASVVSPIENLLQQPAATPPQRSIAGVIEDICPAGVIAAQDFQDRCDEVVDGVLGAVSGSPSGTDLAGARQGLQAMAPEEDAVVASSQVDADAGTVDTVRGRLAAARGGAPTGVALGVNGQGLTGLAAGGALSSLSIYVNGEYAASDRDVTLRESGFDADTFGFTVGADWQLVPEVLLGAAFGYHNTDADIAAGGGNVDSDQYSVLVYASYNPSANSYLDTVFGYSTADIDQRRTVAYTVTGATVSGGGAIGTTAVAQTALSSTDSDEWSVEATLGYNAGYGAWTLNPYLTLAFADTDIDGFRERMSSPTAAGSGLALAIDSQDFQSLTTGLGANVYRTVEVGWGHLYPRAGVQYTHEFDNDNEPVTGRFVNDTTGETFTLLTDPPDRNYVTVGAGLAAELAGGVVAFADYQALLGYDNLDIHAVQVGVRIPF